MNNNNNYIEEMGYYFLDIQHYNMIENLSQEDTAILSIGETMNDFINPFMLHQNVIKDDVFLAQPSVMDYDDTASLSSQSSSIITSPPTQFLYQQPPTIKDVDLLDIFGTDIMLPTIENTTTTTTKSSKRRKKPLVEDSPILKKKKRLLQETSWNQCHLIEPITENDNNKTVFQHLTEQSIDWCRYCGTTEGVNWRPGPWGKRTLCNKHGCDYKGYGLANRLPRLDLSLFIHESLKDRKRPVIQHFCIQCQFPELKKDKNPLIVCEGGCSRAYHQQCLTPIITINPNKDSVRWYCSAACKENRKHNKVVVELPRKHIPLMHLLSL